MTLTIRGALAVGSGGMQFDREELLGRLARLLPADGVFEPLDGLVLKRLSEPSGCVYGTSRASLCLIAQGRKEVLLGDQRYAYDPHQYLLTTFELPVTGRVVEASADRPYLSVQLVLDPAMVDSVVTEAALTTPRRTVDAKALVVSPVEADLLNAVVRLVRLVEAPGEARVLAPLVKREIVFRLLLGEQGHRLRHLPALGSSSMSIAQAVERIRREFDRPLRIASLARDLGMSTSGFHQHFKAVTDMSPLQYQKQIRLHEARRMMLGEEVDAASAAFRVGYRDASQFSREYKRQFGEPPIRDVDRLRQTDRQGQV